MSAESLAPATPWRMATGAAVRPRPARRGHPPAAAIAVIGYYLPLLGIPLAAFLAVDIAVGEIAHRRTTTPAA
ncbi:hypothetical protein CFP59_08112 [Streptomyces malaysiensis subsp. malaysiensis]|nr:hypothetical protein CFP59_08112 [Streptomyces sp. M56]